MPDTIRTIQELNALLADNTTGAISAQDLRDVLVSLSVHTEIGMASQAGASVGTTFTKVPLDIAGAFERGFVADTLNNQISGTPVNLKALVTVEVDVTSLQNGRTLDFGVFLNGVEDNRLRRTATGAEHISWSVGVQLSQNDTIDLRVRASGANTSYDLGKCLLRAQRIGVE